MKIVVCNVGSTSFKFQLLDMEDETQRARGYIERVGESISIVNFWLNDLKISSGERNVPTIKSAVKIALEFLLDPNNSLLSSIDDIDGIGFKTIQAGDKNGSVILDNDVLRAMEDYSSLAPAHNPPYLEAIYVFKELLPHTNLVGVFEPGFHVDIPDYAKVYGVPYEWIEKYGVVKYGYHGASHRFITSQTLKLLQLDPNNHKIISIHLGGSSSLCAFMNGKSIDTTMGFTPQSGLIQGARIGDIDPFVFPYIMEKKKISLEEALVECSKDGGLKGLSGISADMREINSEIENGNDRASLARNKFIYDIKRYIGEYIVLMEGVDAITFTGGIGQKDSALRKEILSSLSFLGMTIYEEKNLNHEEIVSGQNSKIVALVLETNEELVVARETKKVIMQSS
ncbi:MAG: acetate/propionate family kinase [Melioribacteraceae bacterium]|nr:acetate/propionate family kinase [Melioribacteraceae bacterium]